MLLQKDEAVIRLFCFYQQGGDAALTTATIGRAAVTRSDSRFWKSKVLTWLLKPKLDFPWRLFFFFVIFYYLQSEDHIWSGCCVYSCRVYSCCHLSLGYHSNQTHILKKKNNSKHETSPERRPGVLHRCHRDKKKKQCCSSDGHDHLSQLVLVYTNTPMSWQDSWSNVQTDHSKDADRQNELLLQTHSNNQ